MLDAGPDSPLPPGLRPPRSPWLTIWLHPRQTLRRILENDPNRGVYRLGALAGVAQSLSLAKVLAEALDRPLAAWSVAALVLVGGPGLGILSLHVRTALLQLTSLWLGGSAGWRQVRAAVAWASVPEAASLAAWAPAIVLMGGAPLEPGLSDGVLQGGPMMIMALLGLGLVQLVCGGWSFVLLIQGLAETEDFSPGRALASTVIAATLGGAAVLAAGIIALAAASAL